MYAPCKPKALSRRAIILTRFWFFDKISVSFDRVHASMRSSKNEIVIKILTEHQKYQNDSDIFDTWSRF